MAALSTAQAQAAYVQWVHPRVADVSFVIDQFSNATAIAELLPRHGHQKFPTDRVVMLHLFLGGVTAVIAAR